LVLLPNRRTSQLAAVEESFSPLVVFRTAACYNSGRCGRHVAARNARLVLRSNTNQGRANRGYADNLIDARDVTSKVKGVVRDDAILWFVFWGVVQVNRKCWPRYNFCGMARYGFYFTGSSTEGRLDGESTFAPGGPSLSRGGSNARVSTNSHAACNSGLSHNAVHRSKALPWLPQRWQQYTSFSV
jgi:hypothetical protein